MFLVWLTTTTTNDHELTRCSHIDVSHRRGQERGRDAGTFVSCAFRAGFGENHVVHGKLPLHGGVGRNDGVARAATDLHRVGKQGPTCAYYVLVLRVGTTCWYYVCILRVRTMCAYYVLILLVRTTC